MLLIAREELILAVIEGSLLFWAAVFMVSCLAVMFKEAVGHFWGRYQARRDARRVEEFQSSVWDKTIG